MGNPGNLDARRSLELGRTFGKKSSENAIICPLFAQNYVLSISRRHPTIPATESQRQKNARKHSCRECREEAGYRSIACHIEDKAFACYPNYRENALICMLSCCTENALISGSHTSDALLYDSRMWNVACMQVPWHLKTRPYPLLFIEKVSMRISQTMRITQTNCMRAGLR